MNSQEMLQLIKSRRSIRKFKQAEIPETDVKQIIEAASFAPSNANFQPWKFLYIKEKETKKSLSRIVSQKIAKIQNKIKEEETKNQFKNYALYFNFFAEAPGLIIALYKKSPSVLKKLVKAGMSLPDTAPELCSVSAAIQNILLALHSLGYGACWMTGPLIAKEELETFLKIAPPFQIAALIPFGIPDELKTIPKRKDLPKIFGVR